MLSICRGMPVLNLLGRFWSSSLPRFMAWADWPSMSESEFSVSRICLFRSAAWASTE